MYRDGPVYDEIDKVIADIFLDYDIKDFPIDEHEVCQRIGVRLIPYSQYTQDERRLLKKKSEFAFFVKESLEQPPTIYYNDWFVDKHVQRYSIFHELKHFVFDDENDEDDDLAEYFSRHFACPTPFMMLKDPEAPEEIALFCNLSIEASYNAFSNIVNRRRKYGMNLFDFEVPLIEHLDPSLIEVNQCQIMKK